MHPPLGPKPADHQLFRAIFLASVLFLGRPHVIIYSSFRLPPTATVWWVLTNRYNSNALYPYYYTPVPSTVESNTLTSVARVADGGFVTREVHTISVELFSVTVAKFGSVKYAAVKLAY
jgi:hypothetical protein